jgi:hypothetical protein
MASDCAGNLYVGETALRKVVMSTGEVTTLHDPARRDVTALASDCEHLYAAVGMSEGDATIQELNLSTGEVRQVVDQVDPKKALAVDCDGNLYASDWLTTRITKIAIDSGQVTTLVEPSSLTSSNPELDGVGTEARFTWPQRPTSDGEAYLYLFDANPPSLGGGARLRRIDVETGAVDTIAGSFESGNAKDGVGEDAGFARGGDVALDGDTLYVLDGAGNAGLRRVDLRSRAVSTIDVDLGNNGEVLTLGSDGQLYSAGQTAVLRLDEQTGGAVLLAGDPFSNEHRDGIGADARFGAFINALTADGKGSLFAGESNVPTSPGSGASIRRIDEATGEVTTLAGSHDSTGSEDGVGSDARFTHVIALASDQDDTLYALDRVFIFGDYPGTTTLIRKITVSTGEVTTLPGPAPLRGFDPCKATLGSPEGLAVLPSGELAITDPSIAALLILDPR